MNILKYIEITDLFMEDYESKINFQIGTSTITGDWLCYRDDTWMIWLHSNQELENFVAYLNSIDPNIK